MLSEKLQYTEDSPLLKEAFRWIEEWQSDKEEFIIQTSGSTGVPKAICITRNQMILSAKLTLKTLQLQPQSTMLINLNPAYIAGKMMLVRGIIGDFKMLFTAPTANPLLHIHPTTAIDFFSFVPLQLETILKETPEKINLLNKAKAIIVGGAPISVDLENALQIIKAPVYHTYGMTETVSHIALRKLNHPNKSAYFRTLQGIQISTDQRNCLCVQHEITQNKQLCTNDIIKFIDNQTFEWIGRADEVINSGGVKIFPPQLESEIEAILQSVNIANRFFIIGIDDVKLGQTVNLIIEAPVDFSSEEIKSIKSQLNKNLPKYHTPKNIFIIKKFEETATSKVDKKKTFDASVLI
jgi:O-succinylbenzoic acid--CoA ligase